MRARKGWTVGDEHVYVDDGISGAEFAARPGFVRLMNALKPRPPFHVLVMSEESRLGREAIETAYALEAARDGRRARVRSTSKIGERTLDSPTDKIMLSLTAFADELEREKARQRVTDATGDRRGSGERPLRSWAPQDVTGIQIAARLMVSRLSQSLTRLAHAVI